MYNLIGLIMQRKTPRKELFHIKLNLLSLITKTVPQTDTGGQVEYTKALERTMLKELGKLHL